MVCTFPLGLITHTHLPLEQCYRISLGRPPEAWHTLQSWSCLFFSKEDFSLSFPFLKAFFSSAIKRRAISWKGKYRQHVRGCIAILSLSCLKSLLWTTVKLDGCKARILPEPVIRDQMTEQKWDWLHAECPEDPQLPGLCLQSLSALFLFLQYWFHLAASLIVSYSDQLQEMLFFSQEERFLCQSCNRQHNSLLS